MEIVDLVIAQAGTDEHTAVVEVVKIEYFSKDNVPFPVEKAKHIIRKCSNEDFE